MFDASLICRAHARRTREQTATTALARVTDSKSYPDARLLCRGTYNCSHHCEHTESPLIRGVFCTHCHVPPRCSSREVRKSVAPRESPEESRCNFVHAIHASSSRSCRIAVLLQDHEVAFTALDGSGKDSVSISSVPPPPPPPLPRPVTEAVPHPLTAPPSPYITSGHEPVRHVHLESRCLCRGAQGRWKAHI